jgi:protein ImuA
VLEQLRQHLQVLQKPAALAGLPDSLALGVEPIDAALGGGLACGALHEIAAPGEPHLAAATGFALALAARQKTPVFWAVEDMALSESGAPYGPGLDVFGLAPERLLTISTAHRRDMLWAMEEALRCRAVGAVIGELRQGKIDMVAMRRLSLAAGETGALALLLRSMPPRDTSTAATRWIVGTTSSSTTAYGPGPPRLAVHLTRNRRGSPGSWILEWSDIDERFVLATRAQLVAAPAHDRSRRQIA